MTIKTADINRLIELFRESEWNEFHIELDGLQLFLSNDPNARLTSSVFVGNATTPVVQASETVAISSAAVAGTTAADIDPAWEPIFAPNLGTFYRSPKPGEPAFVGIGQSVEADTEICIIEVMKLFTTLKAGIRGIIRQVCVEDSELVESGQILFYIERT